MSLEIHNIAPTQDVFNIATGDPDAADAVPLLQAYLHALEYCRTAEISVSTAVYTPEKAYIYIHTSDKEWHRKIPL
jgi:hypothetical protein